MLSHDRVKATKIQLNEVCKKKKPRIKESKNTRKLIYSDGVPILLSETSLGEVANYYEMKSLCR